MAEIAFDTTGLDNSSTEIPTASITGDWDCTSIARGSGWDFATTETYYVFCEGLHFADGPGDATHESAYIANRDYACTITPDTGFEISDLTVLFRALMQNAVNDTAAIHIDGVQAWESSAFSLPTDLSATTGLEGPYTAAFELSFTGAVRGVYESFGIGMHSASAEFTISGTVASTGYTLVADSGAFVLTGTAATLRVARKITASSGTFALTGTAAALRAARKMTAVSGAFTLTGTAAGLRAARTIVAGSGSFALTGSDATLTYVPADPTGVWMIGHFEP